MKNKKYQWLTISTISLIVSVINIFHVIIGQAKTPTGFTYLATGHYYLDYFEYLQHISAGIAGRWMPTNYFTIANSPVDWRFFPYILMGKMAWLFHFSPIFTYWFVVFVLTFITLLGFYYLINLMLFKEKFSLKLMAFLISISSGPFYQVFIKNNQLIINPFDFWYGPASFIRRFEVVPYHALGLVLLIFIIARLNKIWQLIAELSYKKIFFEGLFISILIIIKMTFAPIALTSLLPSLLIIFAIHFLKNKKERTKIFLLNIVILVVSVPTALILRKLPGYGGMSFEIKWMSHDSLWFILLNIGPMILFFPFGIKKYFQENNFLKQILILFVLISYILYVSPLAYYLGIHNLRFFSSINYIFYAVLTVLGAKNISIFFGKHKQFALFTIISILIIYSSYLTFNSLKSRLLGFDQTIPETVWTYVPTTIIEGLRSIRKPANKNVLTGPYGGIGMLVPIYSYQKVHTSNRFYTGQMSEKEAIDFLNINKIGFIVLTSYDHFETKNINQYSFLKPIFTRESIIIWKVNR